MVGGREKDSEEKHYRIFRLLLTDSGHYILPTDHEQTARVAKETKKEVMLFTQKVAEESAKLWNDVHDRVRHCFLNYKRPVTVLQPGGDRGEQNEDTIHSDSKTLNHQERHRPDKHHSHEPDSVQPQPDSLQPHDTTFTTQQPDLPPSHDQPSQQHDALRPEPDSVPLQQDPYNEQNLNRLQLSEPRQFSSFWTSRNKQFHRSPPFWPISLL